AVGIRSQVLLGERRSTPQLTSLRPVYLRSDSSTPQPLNPSTPQLTSLRSVYLYSAPIPQPLHYSSSSSSSSPVPPPYPSTVTVMTERLTSSLSSVVSSCVRVVSFPSITVVVAAAAAVEAELSPPTLGELTAGAEGAPEADPPAAMLEAFT